MLLIITRLSQVLEMAPEERRRFIKRVTLLAVAESAKRCERGHKGCSDRDHGACLDEVLGLRETPPGKTITAKIG